MRGPVNYKNVYFFLNKEEIYVFERFAFFLIIFLPEKTLMKTKSAFLPAVMLLIGALAIFSCDKLGYANKPESGKDEASAT